MPRVYVNETGNFMAVAGETITAGAAVGLQDSDGYVYNANAATGADQQVCCGFAEVAVVAGERLEIKTQGQIDNATEEDGSTFAEGSFLYLGETDGTVTHTAPTDAGDIVQPVGQAITTTKFRIGIEIYSTVSGLN